MTILRLLPVLLLAACATRSALQRSEEFAAQRDFERAYFVLDEAMAVYEAEGNEAPAALVTAYDQARKLHLYDRAEDRIFTEHEDAALADLGELAALDPAFPGLAAMRDRALDKKATRICVRAQEAMVRKDYAAALVAYLEAEKVVPGYPPAQQGVESVRAATERMTKRAQEQFLEAVRKVPEFRHVEVQWHAANVLHNTPDRADVVEIQGKARRENALKLMASGRESERKGRYGAALVSYRAARKVDADVPEVAGAITAMEREVKAQQLVDAAQVDLRAGRTDVARAKLDEAFELSVLARNDIGLIKAEVRKAEADKAYRAARDLEVLGRKLDALQAFTALVATFPEGVSDEKARVDGLKADVAGWGKHWAAADVAEQAGELEKALEEGLEAQRYYASPEGKERLAKLRAAIAAKKAAAGATQG
jgi:tetratricopeptide (TPR) repeat protein